MKGIFYLLCFLLVLQIQAQKPQFSQFIGTTTYPNPAFAGQSNQTRVTSTFRYQWPELGNIKTKLFSIDGAIFLNENKPSNIGIGLNVISHEQDQWFKQTKINGQFAYKINAEDWKISLGLQAGLDMVQFGNLNSYTFTDQFVTLGNGLATNTSTDPLANANYNSNKLETGAGFIIDWNRNDKEHPRDYTRWWAGASFEYSQYNPFIDINNKLNHRIFYSFHGGVKLPIELLKLKDTRKIMVRDEFLSIIYNYRKQYGTNQLDLMVQWTYSPITIALGYRGIPLKKTKNSFQNDALVVSGGLRFGRYMIQYSYDQTISSLRGYTGGSHEISVWFGITGDLFKFGFPNSSKNRQLDCFSFD